MQQRKFFLKRLRQYLAVFIIPVAIILILSFVIAARGMVASLEDHGQDVTRIVNSDVDLSMNSIVLQNSQFANNPYMLMSIRRIFEKRGAADYQDALQLRALNASFRSCVSTYPYVRGILLYLDGYDYCYSSNGGMNVVTGQEPWYLGYQAMAPGDTASAVILPSSDVPDSPSDDPEEEGNGNRQGPSAEDQQNTQDAGEDSSEPQQNRQDAGEDSSESQQNRQDADGDSSEASESNEADPAAAADTSSAAMTDAGNDAGRENTDGTASSTLTLYQRIPLYNGVVVMSIDIPEYRKVLGSLIVLSKGERVIFMNSGNQILFTWGQQEGSTDREGALSGGSDPENGALRLDVDQLPEEGGPGRWIDTAGGRFLVHQTLNESYNIRVISLIPASRLRALMLTSAPVLLVVLVIGVAALFLAALFTTRKNFGYISHIVNVLSLAEQGQFPDLETQHKITDEYDVILNNIISLHLKTEQLHTELVDKQHAQEVAALTALQAQINPHFLFNTLQMIEVEAASGGDPAKVQRMTSELADILKYALRDATKPIPLRDEIAYLKEYVDIQKMRFGDHFIIYYEVEEDLDDFPVFPLMLQPLVENSISHGLRPKEGRGYIKVSIFRERGTDRVAFRVFDTGVGMDREELERVRDSIREFNVHNIGLANVNMRLRLYFSEQSQIQIHSVKGRGTAVCFEIPESGIRELM